MAYNGLDVNSGEGLQQWLGQIGYTHLFEPLQAPDIGVRTLGDLINYRHEDYTADQSLKKLLSELGVGILLRRKFLQQMTLLRDSLGETAAQAVETKQEEPQTNEEPEQAADADTLRTNVPEKRRSVQMNRAEDQAVSRLTSAIKTHTVAIQKLEPNVGEVQNEAQALRRELEEKFEEIRSAFETAKAQLVKNLTLAESDAVNKVQTELTSVKQSAGKLLQCHQQVTAPLSEAVDDEERRQRSQFVVSTIAEALGEAPSSMYEHHLLFQTEEVNFQELFANYGKIIINRRKIRASAATE